jgi:flagellar basal body-associated protein FliL
LKRKFASLEDGKKKKKKKIIIIIIIIISKAIPATGRGGL